MPSLTYFETEVITRLLAELNYFVKLKRIVPPRINSVDKIITVYIY